jgi:hypothetical protein
VRAFNFEEFCINEGASVNRRNGMVTLNWSDDRNDEYEFLKTNNTMEVANIRKTGQGNFPIYFGLAVDQDRLNDLQKKADVKMTLDWLKQSKIEGGLKSIVNFAKPTIDYIKRTNRVDYVIPMGSTKGLSKDLSEAIASLIGSAEVVPLNKHEFDNISQAIDWDYVESYEDNPKTKTILPQLKAIIREEIDTTSADVLNRLRRVTDWRELKGLLLRSNPNNRYFKPEDEITWLNDSFKIRSSGELWAGLRQAFKTKYETPKRSGEFGSPDFVEAFRRCVLNNKTMLLVDDNTRSKKDLSNIIDTLLELGENILADLPDRPTLSQMTWTKRILSYVLIFVPDHNAKISNRVDLAKDDEVKSIEPFYNINREIEDLEDK